MEADICYLWEPTLTPACPNATAQCAQCATVPSNTSALTKHGLAAQSFNRVVLTHDRGVPFTPIAILSDCECRHISQMLPCLCLCSVLCSVWCLCLCLQMLPLLRLA